MRMRRMQHGAMRHAGQHDVVDVAALAGEKPRILDPPHRLPDPELGHFLIPDELSGRTIFRRRAGSNVPAHDPEKWLPVFGPDHAPERVSAPSAGRAGTARSA